MEHLGYEFHQRVLNALDYGIPQKRERIYMVCFRKDLGEIDFNYPKPIKLTRHVEDFLLEDESLTQKLYVNRPDTFYNSVTDDTHKKSIRLGIVKTKAVKAKKFTVQKALQLLFLLMWEVFFC